MTSAARLRHSVSHARAYPFRIPSGCYLFSDGAVRPMPPDEASRVPLREARAPVIALGSNRSPEQLARKYRRLYRDAGTPVTIPVEHALLAGFDVVYAAHFSSYGSITATIHPSPGTRVEVSLGWLTAPQLAIMHETEGGYHYVALEGIGLETASGHRRTSAFVYVGRNGALAADGQAIAVAEAGAEGRCYRALSQSEVQSLVRARLAPEMSDDTFIRGTIEDSALRRRRNSVLAADALPFAWSGARIVEDVAG